MADIKTVVAKCSSLPMGKVQLPTLNASDDIVTEIDNAVFAFWNSLTNGALAQDEIDVCKATFYNAIMNNAVDKQAMSDLNDLFNSSFSYYTDQHQDTIFLSQLLKQHNMQEPSARVMYVAQDVSTAAKDYERTKTANDKEVLLANLGAFYNSLNALIVLMDDENEFDRFRMVMDQALNANGRSPMPTDVTLNGKIYDGLMIRGSYRACEPQNDPNTEARLLSAITLSTYPNMCVPSRTVEAFMPSCILFFNAKRLARATTTDILNAKNNITQYATLDKSRILSFAQMASLSTMTKTMQKMATMVSQLNGALAQSSLAKGPGKFVIEKIDMSRVRKKLIKIETKMKNVDVSKNPTYHNFETYQRPNRREPFNPDLTGLSMDLGYYPDIHLYVDTSGSISQKDYEDSVAMIIDIAKKLNCDIYFNSFTTDISQEVVVKCRNRSKAQIQKDIEKIPKITGGTTIDQVYSYINATNKNMRQLSILISDFYVEVPRYVKHPKNLWYIPTKDTNPKFAQEFANRLPDPWRVLF